MPKKVRRLYASFHPESYSLKLQLEADEKKFYGQVTIDGIKVGRPSARLTFHQKNLKIKQAKVTHLGTRGNQVLKVSRINYHASFDEIRLHFDHQLYAGRYQIEFSFEGQINTQLHGIYGSVFKERGKDKVILCTQFESHHAREAFPCIDEPEAKAVFNLTLVVPKELPSVISNTEVSDSKLIDNYVETSFAPSPKMSSYLLAFIAGELKYLEAKTSHGVTVRTYATANNIEHCAFALEVATKTLDFYDDYFALAYPLAKCDLIALPDFASGAMENWGCLTFREQALLVDPTTTSLELKQYVANVVAHELTHQWFGDLVTMRWWNDLWLNESFASWMSYLAVDHLFPQWQAWTQFIVDEQSVGLKLDSLEHTHPIEVKISNPDEIRVVFDSISYEKGASVITMLHDYLGPETFRDGIRLYLSEHTYANTSTNDLWQALQSVSAKPVGQFMSHWTTKEGYPLLKANFSRGNVHLEQHRFYLNPMADKLDTVWPIPLFSDLDVAKNDPFVHRSLNLSLINQPASFLINKGRRGFYRVIYDDSALADILENDFMKRVSDVDRMGLIADAFEAAKAGYLPSLSVLKMLDSYSGETSLVVWEVIAGGLGSIRNAMDDQELRESMKPYVRSLVKSEIERLGLKAKKDDGHFDRLLRPTILGLAAMAEEPTVIKYMKKLFYDTEPTIVDPDIRGIVYTTIARHGSEVDFNELLRRHNSSESQEERLKLTAALTNFKGQTLIKRSLTLIKTPDVRLQDAAYWLSYSFSNYYAKDLAWNWLKDNWSWLEENLGEDLSFYRMPFYAARSFSSLDFLNEFQSFFNEHLSAAFERPIKQAIETIQWQAAWRSRDLGAIKNFFSKWPKR